MRGHSRLKTASLPLAYARASILQEMDCRIKSGNDASIL
jgi:hypothetical protein